MRNIQVANQELVAQKSLKRDGSYITVVFDQGLNVHKCLDQERLGAQVFDQGLNVYSAWSGKNRTEVHDHGRDVSKYISAWTRTDRT